MKKALTLLSLAFVCSIVFLSCKKDDEGGDSNSTQSTTASPSYNYPNSGGALVAVNTKTDFDIPEQSGGQLPDGFEDALGDTQIDFITAVAVFWEETGNESYLDAGDVTFADADLTKQDNNAYVLMNTSQEVNASDSKTWNVEGNGDVPAISYTNSMPYPSVSGFDGEVTITAGQDFTLSYGSVSSADSVLVHIAKGNVSIMKTVAGNVSSVTFTGDETSELESGEMTLIQVTPYNLNPQDFGGKDYYFVNQTTYSSYDGTVE